MIKELRKGLLATAFVCGACCLAFVHQPLISSPHYSSSSSRPINLNNHINMFLRIPHTSAARCIAAAATSSLASSLSCSTSSSSTLAALSNLSCSGKSGHNINKRAYRAACMSMQATTATTTTDISSSSQSVKEQKTEEACSIAVGSANLDWANLGFAWRDTNCHLKYTFKDGKWNEGEVVTDPYVKVHIANTAMHYGQAVFEGLKAFHQKDGSVRIFRADENAKRIQRSAARILIEPPTTEIFIEGCKRAVAHNLEFVPPYGSGGALYIRPLLYGSGARIGLQPADEYTLLIMVIPVGDYYKGGMKPCTAVVIDDFDRAAPKGVGSAKVAGNYAADMLPNTLAKKSGYPIGLYLDAKTNTLVEEYSTSNFFGITKDNKYITPASPAVLASITNLSLMQLAADMGMKVEKRDIPLTEVKTLSEVGACGTAVVLTAIKEIVHKGDVIALRDDIGPVSQALYDRVRGIQNGDLEDKFGWMEAAC